MSKESVLLTEKEGKEIIKRKEQLNKPVGKYYIVAMIFFVGIIYIVDEITSNISSQIQPYMINYFFVDNGVDFNDGLSLYSLLKLPGVAFMFILPFYKALADKYGRKPFLVFNTMGMGLAMIICFLAPNIYVFTFGGLIGSFFIPNDMQVMYIMEAAPEKHRAKIASTTKAIGYLGVTAIPLLMRIAMSESEANWQNTYIVPIIIAVVVSIISLIAFKETPAFLIKRINHLEGKPKTTEEIKVVEASEKGNDKKEKTGVIEAVKFIFKHTQIRYVAIACILFAACTSISGYYSSIMVQGGMTMDEVTEALLFYPVVNAAMTFCSGFLTDFAGRKKSAIILGTSCLAILALFVLGSSSSFPPILLGVLYGLFSGLLWSLSDLVFIIIPTESTPTHLRASVLGTLSLVFTFGGVAGALTCILLLSFFDALGLICLGVACVFMPLSLLVIAFKVKETKGSDLGGLTGAEWD